MNKSLILFQIGGRICGFYASDVQTVIEIDAITAVPRAPCYVVGLTALRSQTLTVLDTRKIVGAADSALPTDSRAVVIEVGGYSYALQVDEIRDVGISKSEPKQVTGGFGPSWQNFAEGMVETEAGPVLLLNTVNFIAACEKRQAAA